MAPFEAEQAARNKEHPFVPRRPRTAVTNTLAGGRILFARIPPAVFAAMRVSLRLVPSTPCGGLPSRAAR